MQKRKTFEVLLRGGSHDHYIERVPLNVKQVEVDGERYERTDEVAKVKHKRQGVQTYRVFVAEEQVE